MRTRIIRTLFFLCIFGLCFEVLAQSLTILDSSTPESQLRALDGAVFHQSPTGVLLETQGAQAQGRTVFPGIAILGEWDLSQFNAIEVEVEHRDTKTRLPLRIRLAGGGEANLSGVEDAFIGQTQVRKHGIETCVIPVIHRKFETTGMRRTPWDCMSLNDTLLSDRITSVGIYMDRPLLDWKWTVKRVTLKKLDWSSPETWEKSGLLQKERPFTQPTIADYYRFSDAHPVWENMTPEEFFPFIDCYGQFKFKEWPGKIHSDAELQQAREDEAKDLAAHPGPEGWDEFGGWAAGPQLEATGHFRVEKIDGKWWMVDPLGHLFWSHGPVRINASSAVTPLDGRKHYFEELPAADSPLAEFYHTNDAVLKDFYTVRNIQETFDFSSANAWRKYGGAGWWEKYADVAHRRLRSWGMNTIANSSDVRIALQNRTPFCDRLTMQSPFLEGADDGFWWNFRDPFHPEFRKNIHDQLIEHRAETSSPWCLGFFVDNELNWGGPTSLAEWTLKSPSKQPAKKVFVDQLRKKYETIEKLNAAWGGDYVSWEEMMERKAQPPKGSAEDCASFSADMIREYFSVIQDEFRKEAPNTLYLGCRFAGSNESVLRIAAEYCDVLSFNIYRFTLDDYNLPKGVDKPVFVGEFHFGALDRGMLHWTLVGVENQEERGKAYYNYVDSALRHPNFIGVHWHQYAEQATTGRFDGENYQNGFVDVCDTPYVETIAKIREIGYQLYEIRANSKSIRKEAQK